MKFVNYAKFSEDPAPANALLPALHELGCRLATGPAGHDVAFHRLRATPQYE
jgi:hypothetical protein